MNRKLFILVLLAVFLGFSYNRTSIHPLALKEHDIESGTIQDTSLISLKEGDILVRPNWGWLPGSCFVKDGRKYGHVAIVTRGAVGRTMEESLKQAEVVEALFFDQATKEFQFNKKDQIREGKADVSFGKKFKGIRYRLRTNLSSEQARQMLLFLRNQLDGGYNIFSSKKQLDLPVLRNENWHCASLVWEAYFLFTEADIDANGGKFIYPSDIIASKNFDLDGGRIRF